jgi:hypothetical protein
MHPSRRSLLSALAAAMALSALVAGPAAARTGSSSGRPIVHPVPKMPIVVDGVRYAPEQIHRFDGRPLYSRLSKDGKSIIATTKLGRYRAFLRSQGIRLPTLGKTPTARASGAGQVAKLCTDRAGHGFCFEVNSGFGVANLNALGMSGFFANNVEWLRTTGGWGPVVIFDRPDFDARGGMFAFPPGEWEMTPFGWSNRADSLYVPW